MKKQIIMAVSLLFLVISAHTQTITVIAGTGSMGYTGDGSSATACRLNLTGAGLVDGDGGIAVDGLGNMYIADAGNNVIRKINTFGIISTFAGSSTGTSGYSGDGGPATLAQLSSPAGVAVDTGGNVYIADGLNNVIRKVTPSGVIRTVAGNGLSGYSGDGGSATAQKLNTPVGIALDAAGNMYIADSWTRAIRKVTVSGIISTYAGTDTVVGFSGSGGAPTSAKFNLPTGVTVDGFGRLYIADIYNNVIWKVVNPTTEIRTDRIPPSLLSVYPNPVKDALTVAFTSTRQQKVQVVITDVAGRKILQQTVLANMPADLYFEASSGIYLLSAFSGDEIWREKIVKE